MIRSTAVVIALGRNFARSHKPSVSSANVGACEGATCPFTQNQIIFLQRRQLLSLTGARRVKIDLRDNCSFRKRKENLQYSTMSSPSGKQSSQSAESDSTSGGSPQPAANAETSEQMEVDASLQMEPQAVVATNGTDEQMNRDEIGDEISASTGSESEDMEFESRTAVPSSPIASSSQSSHFHGINSQEIEVVDAKVDKPQTPAQDEDDDVIFLTEVRGAPVETKSVSYYKLGLKPEEISGIEGTKAGGSQSQARISRRSKGLIGVVQMTSTNNKRANFAFCTTQIRLAKEEGALIVFLPECFDYIGAHVVENKYMHEPLDGPTVTHYRSLAAELKIWLSLGGLHEQQDALKADGNPYMKNTHIIINDMGEIVETYNKIHLFDLDEPVGGISMKESDFMLPGSEVKPAVKTPVGDVGLGICYDVRFPEFAAELCAKGAQILTFPSAFTVPTGQAHWKSLLRARAIENQAYVVAAAQFGQHNPKRMSYGHSMVVDPWGRVLHEARDDESLMLVALDMRNVDSIRRAMPVRQHKRPDVYGRQGKMKLCIPSVDRDEENFKFGHINAKVKMSFLESEHSLAFVNRKCVVPGHVLVIPKEMRKRMADMTKEERSDLFEMVSKVQTYLEEIHGAGSSTIAMQDGPDAGQTVEHFHVHILPRKPMDFANNDDVYQELQKHDKGDKVEWRQDEDMVNECKAIREHIAETHAGDLTVNPDR